MAVAPSGPMSLPFSGAKTLLSNSSNFQTWVGAGNATAALASIHLIHLAGTSVAAARPYALIMPGDFFEYTAIAGGAGFTFSQSGTLSVMFEDDIVSADIPNHDDAFFAFTNVIGEIVGDLASLSGISGALAVIQISVRMPPARNNKNEFDPGGYYQTTLDLKWDPAG